MVAVSHGLAAVATLVMSPVPYDFILLQPPTEVFSSVEIAEQLKRVSPDSVIALLEAYPEVDDCMAFHDVFSRPDSLEECEKVFDRMRDHLDTMAADQARHG